MTTDECRDKIRFSLSDKSGTLRFEAFDIVDAPDCQGLADAVRRTILGRPLSDIDVGKLPKVFCRGKGQCMLAIADIITEAQSFFVRDRR